MHWRRGAELTIGRSASAILSTSGSSRASSAANAHARRAAASSPDEGGNQTSSGSGEGGNQTSSAWHASSREIVVASVLRTARQIGAELRSRRVPCPNLEGDEPRLSCPNLAADEPRSRRLP